MKRLEWSRFLWLCRSLMAISLFSLHILMSLFVLRNCKNCCNCRRLSSHPIAKIVSPSPTSSSKTDQVNFQSDCKINNSFWDRFDEARRHTTGTTIILKLVTIFQIGSKLFLIQLHSSLCLSTHGSFFLLLQIIFNI